MTLFDLRAELLPVCHDLRDYAQSHPDDWEVQKIWFDVEEDCRDFEEEPEIVMGEADQREPSLTTQPRPINGEIRSPGGLWL